MALTYGFFNSVNHDRVYDARQMSRIFDGVINDGVFQNIGDLFAVTPNEGMDILVGSGRAWFNGTWTLNDTNYSLTVTDSNPLYSRIDAVIIEVNEQSEIRANSIKMVDGTAASDPQRPTLINTELVHQYPLAYITVAANASSITSTDIENVVGLEEEGCPFVTGILQVNGVDYLYSQWQADFETWFDHMKDQLDTDAAGHLQAEIDNLNIILEGTLEAGTTTLTFTSNSITDDSFLDLYADDILISPISMTRTTGSVTYTFDTYDEQQTDVAFRLRVANLPS